MGYTTTFSGQIRLSRTLTLAEAKELLDIRDSDESKNITGCRSRLQWVPTESLDAIVWDGEEKFYEYFELLEWLCGTWLKERDIAANGDLLWNGEDADDAGRITVTNNQVIAFPHRLSTTRSGRPLTKNRLAEMALEALTKAA